VKNHYTVLGVKQNDSEDVIKKAYRKLAKQYHPDNDPGDQAKEKMMEISEAWEVLGNKTNRQQYDEILSNKQPGGKRPFTPTKPEPGRPMTQEDFFNMTRGFDSMLSPEAIKKSAAEKTAPKQSSFDAGAMFEKMMGIKR